MSTASPVGAAGGRAVSQRLHLSARLVALGFLTVVLQQAAVSQISVFGVSADLTPLVVMSVGLLAGSTFGASFGFGTGLVIRRILTPALPEDPRRRRRRAYTTGGLSPLQRPSQRVGPIARSPK